MGTSWQKYSNKLLNDILPRGDQFLKYLKSTNNSIGELMKSSNKKEIELFIQATAEIPELAAYETQRLAVALSEFGWFRKRIALSLIEDIQKESVKFFCGIGILMTLIDIRNE